ncbi:MAG: HupE/UreJ family protein, partial [Rhizomicrobium sp.]
MNFRLKRPALLVLSGLAAILAQPALAHHVMGGAMPANWWQGLLSGLGHPVLGLDHFAAIVAAGFIASLHSRGVALVGLYIISMIVGAAIHEHGVTLPGSEILVAASLLALGVAMQFRLLTGIAAALFS